MTVRSEVSPQILLPNSISCCLLFTNLMFSTKGIFQHKPLLEALSCTCPRITLTPVYPVGIIVKHCATIKSTKPAAIIGICPLKNTLLFFFKANNTNPPINKITPINAINVFISYLHSQCFIYFYF